MLSGRSSTCYIPAPIRTRTRAVHGPRRKPPAQLRRRQESRPRGAVRRVGSARRRRPRAARARRARGQATAPQLRRTPAPGRLPGPDRRDRVLHVQDARLVLLLALRGAPGAR
ncbi:MAG: hypothetical protein EP329_09690 [Deltaproteobacteria bacterium]|nr:MAG: hypothetical protein EP329_09690 [Deltaproteobacteria bacterium]